MKPSIKASSRRTLKRSTLFAALILLSAGAPAWAGVVCQMVDERTGNDANPYDNEAEGDGSSSCGFQNNRDMDESGGGIDAGDESSAFGNGNMSSGRFSSAFGRRNLASGEGSNAFGGSYGIGRNTASGDYSNALGTANTVSGSFSTGVGFQNVASGASSGAFGFQNNVTAHISSAVGAYNTVSGDYSNAFGFENIASAEESSAFGNRVRASGLRSVAVGGWYDGNDDFAIQPGNEATQALGVSAVAVGAGVRAIGDASAAFGVNALANADYSVAIGFGAVADREYTISVGSATRMNQIVNLAAGTDDEDAVNLSQLYPLATALGGGASYAGGIFTAPTYIIQAGNYTNIGSAFTAVDNALTDINQRIVNAGGVQGERGLSAYEVAVNNGFAGTESDWLQSLGGAQGPTGPTGPEGPAGGGPRSVTYDSDTRDVLTLAGTDGTRIANVANGVDAPDAVNLGQMQAGDAATLSAANTHTNTRETAIRADMEAGDAATLQSAQDHADAGDVQTLASANAYTDQRFAEFFGLSDSFENFRNETDRRLQQQDRRIAKQGAMGSAMLNMAMNAAGSQSPRGRIAAGVGFQGGERALSVGYAKRVGTRASFSLGGAFSGSEKSAGVGFGVDL